MVDTGKEGDREKESVQGEREVEEGKETEDRERKREGWTERGGIRRGERGGRGGREKDTEGEGDRERPDKCLWDVYSQK